MDRSLCETDGNRHYALGAYELWGEGNPLGWRTRGFPSPQAPHPSPNALLSEVCTLRGCSRLPRYTRPPVSWENSGRRVSSHSAERKKHFLLFCHVFCRRRTAEQKTSRKSVMAFGRSFLSGRVNQTPAMPPGQKWRKTCAFPRNDRPYGLTAQSGSNGKYFKGGLRSCAPLKKRAGEGKGGLGGKGLQERLSSGMAGPLALAEGFPFPPTY